MQTFQFFVGWVSFSVTPQKRIIILRQSPIREDRIQHSYF